MTKKNTYKIYLFILYILCTLLTITCDRQNKPRETVEAKKQYDGLIIAVGNSLTAGYGVPEQKAWPTLLEKKLQRDGLHWQVINSGISGETSSGMLSRIKWILAQKPDIVILETGANDGFRGIPIPVIKKNIHAAVQLSQQNKVTVLLAGMKIVQNLGSDYTRDFANIYPAIADEQNCLLIPFLLENVAGNPALNQTDNIHPNEEGHQIMVDTIFPYVKKAIHEN
jgi:acyl-CoA thioesterase-1